MKTQNVLSVSKPVSPASSSRLRDRIIEKASRMFLSSGFVRVTAADLARNLGISKRTLYSVFESKDEILRAVVEDMKSEIIFRIDRILNDRNVNFIEKFALLAAAMADRFSSVSPFFLDDIRRNKPDIWKEIEEIRREKVFRRFKSIFEAGRREGYFRADVDLDLTLKIIIDAIERFVTPEAVVSAGLSPGDILRTIFTVFSGGVLTDKGRRIIESKKIFTRIAGEEEH